MVIRMQIHLNCTESFSVMIDQLSFRLLILGQNHALSVLFVFPQSKLAHVLFQLQIEPILIEKGLFGCPLCSVTMKKRANVQRHILIHIGDKPLTCAYCDFSCRRNDHLKNHINKHHVETLIKHEIPNQFSSNSCLINLD